MIDPQKLTIETNKLSSHQAEVINTLTILNYYGIDVYLKEKTFKNEAVKNMCMKSSIMISQYAKDEINHNQVWKE